MAHVPKSSNGSRGRTLIRVFVAIDMPDIVKKEIRRIQGLLKKQNLFEGKYVDPDLAHLTLQFIGYVEPIALPSIKNLLRSITFEPISAKLGIVGSFGDHTLIRVVWLEILGEEITQLVNTIEKTLALGAVALRKQFHAHVTIARVKSTPDVRGFRNALHDITVAPIAFRINQFVLKQSILMPDGPVYVDLEAYDARK